MDSNDITRRRVIGTLGAAGAIGLAGCGGDGDDGEDGGDGGDGGATPTETSSDGGDGGATGRPDETVKIGVMQPTSGPLQFYGNLSLWGFYTGLGYKGVATEDLPGKEAGPGTYEFELGDTTYEIIVRDTLADPSEAQSIAGDLIADENVSALVGTTSSSSAQTVSANVASKANVPFIAGPAASASITLQDQYCSPYTFRTSETVEMDAMSGGKYVAEETDIESVWIYYADYSFGQSVDRFYTKVLEENGVEVLDHTAVPQGYSEDWAGQLNKAEEAGADAMIGGFTVATLPQLVQTFLANDYSFRFVGGYTTMAGAAAFGQIVQQELDELTTESIYDAGMGPFTTRYHWNQYDNEIANEVNQIHRQKYGQNADLYTGGTFTQFSALDQAIQQTGSANPEDIKNALTGMTIQDTPKGEGQYVFQEYNNQARSSMTVSPPVPTENPDYWGAPIQPGEPEITYMPSETTIKEDDDAMGCQL